jgi:hypothetical protein
VRQQRLAVTRRETDAEPLRRGLVEATVGEELPGDESRLVGAELVGIELLRNPVGVDQPRALPGRLAARGARRPPRAAAGRRPSRRGRSTASTEGQAVDLHHEVEDVAALLAAEAVEEAAARA